MKWLILRVILQEFCYHGHLFVLLSERQDVVFRITCSLTSVSMETGRRRILISYRSTLRRQEGKGSVTAVRCLVHIGVKSSLAWGRVCENTALDVRVCAQYVTWDSTVRLVAFSGYSNTADLLCSIVVERKFADCQKCIQYTQGFGVCRTSIFR